MSHSVCLSVCQSVPLSDVVFFYFTVEPSYERTSKIEKLLFSLMGQRHVYFSARTEGRISYGHLGRTNSCFGVFSLQCFDTAGWATGRACKQLGVGLLVVTI